MSRTVDGTFGPTKNQPPTVTRPYDFGTDAIERQRVSLGQSLIDTDFEYGLQATKWQAYQEIRKMPSFYESPGTDIAVSSVTSDGSPASNITVTVNTNLTSIPSTYFLSGNVISISGLSNAQRNADRAEGFFIVRSATGNPVSSFIYESRGLVGVASTTTTISTSYTTLRRGGVYTAGTSYLPFTSATTDGASKITVSFPVGVSHGLVPGTPIQTSNTATLTGITPANGAENILGNFIVASTPTANTFTFTATNTVASGTQVNGTNGFRIYTSPFSYTVHRPFDGGVILSAGQPSFGASSLRQSKKVFRYQSGKGLLWSAGTLFCPNNDVVFANVAGSNIYVTCDIPHGNPQPGATIQLKGISTPGYNGTYTVSNIVDYRTLQMVPPVLPTVSPAILGEQPRFVISGWSGASVRAGCFEDQNGLFWEWDGQTLWVVKRSSTFQLAGYVTATTGSQVINGDTTDTSVFPNSTVNMGTAVAAVTGVTGSYPAGTSTSSINVTVSIKGSGLNLNPGLLMPLSGMSSAPSPGAASVISGSYAGFAQNATTVVVSSVTNAGPIVPNASATNATNLTFLAGYPGFVSIMSAQNQFTFTFATQLPASIAISSIVGNGTTATVTTTAAHNLVSGSTVTITGATPGGFNVSAVPIIVTGTATFTFASTVNATASVVGSITAFTIPAGTFSSVVSTPPATNVRNSTVTASWSVVTPNQTALNITTNATLIAGSSVAVSAFGGYGGYAYVAATGLSGTTATIIFSQPQTLATGSLTSGNIAFNTNPSAANALVDLCDLAYATLSPTTSNNATLTTGSFIANFVVPQTFASGSLTGALSLPLATGASLAGARIIPFSPDPIPAGTSNLMIVSTTTGGAINNGMQTATASFLDIFGSNAYVTSSNSLCNAFIINFPPLGNSIRKTQVTALGAQTFVYPNTRFFDQLRVNDKVTIRGMTHTVVQIQTQGTIIVNPPYRGISNITVPVKMCKIKEVRTPQSQFNRDPIDGTGPSGFNFDPTKMQMIGLQYSWYGAGFVDFMIRGGEGNWVYAHRYKQNNINDEAYMRTGNMPVRYELVNESIASVSTLAVPTGLTDTTLSLNDATTYWPPFGNVMVDNEIMSYTGKSGNTLTGITRKSSIAYNVNQSTYTLTASAAEQYHQAGSTVFLIGTTCTPSLTHWGSAFLMDGSYDMDRGYYFNYSNVTSIATIPQLSSSNVFMIRLAPTVSNGVVGDMGQRDLLNRSQLLLQKLEITPSATSNLVTVTGILNPAGINLNNITWININSTAIGSQPSFAQIGLLGTNGASYINGTGERIFSTITTAGTQNTIDLSFIKELSNSVIGGNGIYPDGPDTLMIQLSNVSTFQSLGQTITNLQWTEAQA
jgi:hypothetical protein